MAIKFWQDTSGILTPYFTHWLNKTDFPELWQGIKFIFTFHSPPKKGEAEGTVRAAFARRIGKHEKDLYGYDFEISVCEDIWKKLTEDARSQLCYHELLHCRAELDPAGNPVLDDENRAKVWCDDHDIKLTTFTKEIEKFGLTPADYEVYLLLHQNHDRIRTQVKGEVALGAEDGTKPYAFD